MKLDWVDLTSWRVDESGWAALVALLLLLVIAWSTAQIRKRSQVKAMLSALHDTTFGRCVPHVRTGAWGFAVAIEPAPEPFRELSVSLRVTSLWDPLDWVAWTVRGERTRLQFAGTLAPPPPTELLWVRNRPPLTVRGVAAGRGPWVIQRLDITQTEYAMRGANPTAMRHAFADLHARFYTHLALVTVQKDRAPHVRLVAEGRLDPRMLSPLVASVRGLGRVALLD